MFTVKAPTEDGKQEELKIEFHHPAVKAGDRRATVCIIGVIKNDNQVEGLGLGVARCSLEDHFRKDVGRKIALHRALQDGRFNRQQRTEIWNEYWRRQPRKPVQ